MPNPIIYFVRHGETDWNRAGRLQGRRDIPINEVGAAQAGRNGAVLAEALAGRTDLDFVASPLKRTRQTMAILLARLGRDPAAFATDERLEELDFGLWEGSTWEELKGLHKNRLKARRSDPFHWRAPEGESYAMLTARVSSWLEDLDRDTVCVSHGGIMRCLRTLTLDLPTRDILRLDVPQDRVMVIADRRISWL